MQNSQDFCWIDGLKVYTTNPYIGQLLRINPFCFPETTHVLEHIDRLMSVFGSCWELTEAMPALLKKSVEQAYIQCGWNLSLSACRTTGPDRWPTFATLILKLRAVIEASDYDSRAKGVYTGALVTRVESLAGGLLGQIFNAENPVPYETLFNDTVVVDLSRLGSSETKSLIMGILVMILAEFRAEEAMTSGETNSDLRHVTVLEEAHNLLRNTRLAAGGGSDVVAKSVETLSNAIAEMRTYGEGFLIVDQSPGALDISATRNTNTKIVMRLPEQEDCEAMSKALALDEWQSQEVAKLDRGVAVVFQSGWRAPVLTKVDKSPDHFTSLEDQRAREQRSDPAAYRRFQQQTALHLIRWGLDTRFGSWSDKLGGRVLTWLREDAWTESPGISRSALDEQIERLFAFFKNFPQDYKQQEIKIGKILVEMLGLQNFWSRWDEKTNITKINFTKHIYKFGVGIKICQDWDNPESKDALDKFFAEYNIQTVFNAFMPLWAEIRDDAELKKIERARVIWWLYRYYADGNGIILSGGTKEQVEGKWEGRYENKKIPGFRDRYADLEKIIKKFTDLNELMNEAERSKNRLAQKGVK